MFQLVGEGGTPLPDAREVEEQERGPDEQGREQDPEDCVLQ
jgi:hypothetical protein